mmetsp:Transcript_13428/g.58712  ORF Transcript_13428/g.58712 Transcript_13428/m.58712 type:complete len:285 (+) Transcript_13428:1519-2373(+)
MTNGTGASSRDVMRSVIGMTGRVSERQRSGRSIVVDSARVTAQRSPRFGENTATCRSRSTELRAVSTLSRLSVRHRAATVHVSMWTDSSAGVIHSCAHPTPPGPASTESRDPNAPVTRRRRAARLRYTAGDCHVGSSGPLPRCSPEDGVPGRSTSPPSPPSPPSATSSPSASTSAAPSSSGTLRTNRTGARSGSGENVTSPPGAGIASARYSHSTRSASDLSPSSSSVGGILREPASDGDASPDAPVSADGSSSAGSSYDSLRPTSGAASVPCEPAVFSVLRFS